MIANKLKPWISSIVSKMQVAFTSQRVIQDNVVIFHRILHQFKLQKKSTKVDMMLKLDMTKLFDLVDWDCLDYLLNACRFSTTWCKWILSCI